MGKDPQTDEIHAFFFFLLKSHKIVVKNPKGQKLVEKMLRMDKIVGKWLT